MLGTRVTPLVAGASVVQPNNFSFATWIKPGAATELGSESNRGAAGLGLKRNDALTAPHGDGFGGNGNAGCGLAVGTNGVCVFEHGANYFAPTLVHAAPILDWTHVAVVYRDGQPNLYLNGALVRAGLKSEYTVHSGASAGGSAQFRGQLGGFSHFVRALSEVEVTELVRTMPRPDQFAAGPPIQLIKRGRQTAALATQPGDFELLMADGKRRKLNVLAVPATQPLTGSREVQFTAGWGAPERVMFAQLGDWTQHPDENILLSNSLTDNNWRTLFGSLARNLEL